MSGSGISWAICKSAPHPRQPRQHPTTQFFTGRMPFLPPNQQRQSTYLLTLDRDALCVEVTVGYLKLDVTSDGVWSAVSEALTSGALDHVQQLGLLVHVTSGRQQRHQATDQWNVLLELERAGFRRWLALPVSSTDARTGRRVARRQPTDIASLYQLVYLNIRFLV